MQLNAYAYIGTKNGYNPISSLLLCYYEPNTFLLVENPEKLDEVLLEDGFYLPFSAHIEKVEIKKKEIIEPLLGEVREIGDMEEAPEGREGCKDCRILEGLRGLL